MEIADKILDVLNNIVLAILTVGFLPQLLYVILFFLKAKKYANAKIQHKFGIVIPARNESNVIEGLIGCIKAQNYPEELIDIIVIADNCTDNTAEIAKKLGANVIERFDDTKRTKGYAMNYAFKQIVKDFTDIESFIIFDADNLVHPDYVKKMNDAFDSGVDLARGYSNSKNLTDNATSCVSGLYYIRDSRFTCQVRSALNIDQNMPGSGMMVSAKIIREKGWDTYGLCEDAEFTFKRLLEGKHTRYVSEAEYFEEQPTTLKDTFNRNIRMGHGLNKLFFTQGIPMFFKSLIKFRYSLMDMFLTLMFIPIAFLCCFWFPIYYGFEAVLAGMHFNTNPNEMYQLLKMAAIALSCMFYLLFVVQTALAVFLERDKLKNANKKVLIKSIFLFPFFMIIYMLSITLGIIIKKPQWKAINHHRTVELSEIVDVSLDKD